MSQMKTDFGQRSTDSEHCWTEVADQVEVETGQMQDCFQTGSVHLMEMLIDLQDIVQERESFVEAENC